MGFIRTMLRKLEVSSLIATVRNPGRGERGGKGGQALLLMRNRNYDDLWGCRCHTNCSWMDVIPRLESTHRAPHPPRKVAEKQ